MKFASLAYACIWHSIMLACAFPSWLRADNSSETTASQIICSFKTTSTFYEFPQHFENHDHINKEKWALITSLNIKSKIAFYLKKLTLQWRGKKLNHISASLYHKRETDAELIPIQDNLICDGSWNPMTQQLSFAPHKKITATDELYLVLSYPETLERFIKQGKFILPSRSYIRLKRASH